MEKDLLEVWKKNSVRIGTPTNLLAAATAFIPVIYLCSVYNCWPSASLVLSAWSLAVLSFGALYVVEPISYYAALGLTGTYLSFLSGNIGNMRVPCAALALEITDSTSGTLRGEIVSTMAICGSIITNLAATMAAAIFGAAIVSILPEFITTALKSYVAAAIFGGTFGNFAVKQPKVAVFSLGIPLVLKLAFGLPSWCVIIAAVFGSLGISRLFYVHDKKKSAHMY